MRRLEVKVFPGVGKDSVEEKEGVLVVRVKAPARDNRANAAVAKLLTRHLGGKARIVSGLRGRRKVVELED